MADINICHCLTTQNQPCRNTVQTGEKFCHLHKEKCDQEMTAEQVKQEMIKRTQIQQVEPSVKELYRHIPEETFDTDELVGQFLRNNQLFRDRNKLCDQQGDIFRIMTYNVHMWRDAHRNINLQPILDTINQIKPDILCLQEVTYNNVYMDQLYKHYELLSGCMINPSDTPNNPYMLLVLIKNGVKWQLVESNIDDPRFLAICNAYSCHLGQQIGIFDNYSPSPDLYAVNNEVKCCIKFSLPNIDIICTHLTAYDITGKNRMKEINKINSMIRYGRKTIILGDFNLIDLSEYDTPQFMSYISKKSGQYGLTDVEYKYITQQLHWIDIYKQKENHRKTFMNYSNWTGFRVDHIFLYGWSKSEIDEYITNTCMYYSDASDHNPLVLDLKKSIISIRQKKKTEQKQRQETEPILKYLSLHKVVLPNDFDSAIRNPKEGINQLVYQSDVLPQKVMLFNIQPLYAIDWFDLPQINYPNNYVRVSDINKFKDPFVTDNVGASMVLGSKSGIYASTSLGYIVKSFLFQLQNSYQKLYGWPANINQTQKNFVHLLFAFSLDLLEQKMQSLIVPRDQRGAQFVQYEDHFYHTYDLLLLDNFPNMKVTVKGLDSQTKQHKYLKLEGIYVCHSAGGILQNPVAFAVDFWTKVGKNIETLGLTYGPSTKLSDGQMEMYISQIWKPSMKQNGGCITHKLHQYKYYCSACNYETTVKSSYRRHLMTKKHKVNSSSLS